MKSVTAVLACLMLLFICFKETDAVKLSNAEYIGRDGVGCYEGEYATQIHQDDSHRNEISYQSLNAAKESRLPYIKQITGAICLLFAWYLMDSNKD